MSLSKVLHPQHSRENNINWLVLTFNINLVSSKTMKYSTYLTFLSFRIFFFFLHKTITIETLFLHLLVKIMHNFFLGLISSRIHR